MFYLLCDIGLFFFKQKTAYEMRISDWSSDVCSSDLLCQRRDRPALQEGRRAAEAQECRAQAGARRGATTHRRRAACDADNAGSRARVRAAYHLGPDVRRSEEHTSELQSLMRISYAVFCLKKKTTVTNAHTLSTPRREQQ